MKPGQLMKAAVYYSNRDIRIQEYPVPEIGDDEILVRVRACGICGSDVMEWYRKKKAPLVLGHEMTGDIVETGENVENYTVGDRVFVSHHVPCNTCHYCLNGHHTVCDTLRSTNFYPGGFSDYVRVPAINVDRGVFRLPDEMSYEQGAFIEPLGCVYRGQRMAGFQPGMSVLIIGSGVTGLLFLKLLQALGAGRIFVSDTVEFKRKKALEFGADGVFDARENIPERLKEQNNGRLADIVVTTTGAVPAVKTAFDSVDRGGTILFFAPPMPEAGINLPLARLWKDEITLKTTYAASPHDLTKAIELIREGRVKVEALITHRLPLERAEEGFRLAAESKESLKVIIEP